MCHKHIYFSTCSKKSILLLSWFAFADVVLGVLVCKVICSRCRRLRRSLRCISIAQVWSTNCWIKTIRFAIFRWPFLRMVGTLCPLSFYCLILHYPICLYIVLGSIEACTCRLFKHVFLIELLLLLIKIRCLLFQPNWLKSLDAFLVYFAIDHFKNVLVTLWIKAWHIWVAIVTWTVFNAIKHVVKKLRVKHRIS